MIKEPAAQGELDDLRQVKRLIEAKEKAADRSFSGDYTAMSKLVAKHGGAAEKRAWGK